VYYLRCSSGVYLTKWGKTSSLEFAHVSYCFLLVLLLPCVAALGYVDPHEVYPRLAYFTLIAFISPYY
jgi:hypothetical protein